MAFAGSCGADAVAGQVILTISPSSRRGKFGGGRCGERRCHYSSWPLLPSSFWIVFFFAFQKKKKTTMSINGRQRMLFDLSFFSSSGPTGKVESKNIIGDCALED
jgi:hypothetical protein